MLLRARVVLPLAQPPLSDGAVRLSGGCIQAVGRAADLRPEAGEEVIDLGEVVLLPGLINAHCHLDYTRMAGLISPMRLFTDWIKAITTCKGGWTYSDFADSWLAGANMLLQSGTTTVVDIEAVPELLPEAWGGTPLRVISCFEMTGVKSRRPAQQILAETLAHRERLPIGHNQFALSPHAPYSTNPDLFQQAAMLGREHNLLVTTHIAESEAEFDMFMYRRGPLFDWLKSQRDMTDCGIGSPVQHAARNGLLNPSHLAVHVNYLWDDDAKLLGESGASVAHCPRSHAYFKHRRFPRRELTQAGVNICVGTDSLASMSGLRGRAPELNLFSELQTLAANDSGITPDELLRMATLNGAHAIGRGGELGQLSAGAQADLIAVPFKGETGKAVEAVVNHIGPVTASMIAGKWAMAPQT